MAYTPRYYVAVALALLVSLCWVVSADTTGNTSENGDCSEADHVSSSIRVASFNIKEVETALAFSCFVVVVIFAKMGE